MSTPIPIPPFPAQIQAISTTRFSEILLILGDVQGVTIQSDQDCLKARALLVRANQTLKAVESERAQAAAPFNAITKQIYEAVRLVTDPLQTAVSLLKTQLAEYINSVEAQRTAAAAEAARLSVVQSADGRLTPAIISIPDERGPAPIATRTVTTVEITDLALIPRKYLIPNLAMIEADVRAGIDVPGCRLVNKTTVVAR
jgi:hypothetical protein